MSDLNKDVIAKRLRAIREGMKLSQSEFAERVGISQAAISQFEDSKRVPSMATLQKIASSLSISVAHLVKEEVEGDDEKQKLMEELKSKLEVMNTETLQVMNRFVTDIQKAMNKGEDK